MVRHVVPVGNLFNVGVGLKSWYTALPPSWGLVASCPVGAYPGCPNTGRQSPLLVVVAARAEVKCAKPSQRRLPFQLSCDRLFHSANQIIDRAGKKTELLAVRGKEPSESVRIRRR
jgi:hypothetical protein